jgi:hypothetical protein
MEYKNVDDIPIWDITSILKYVKANWFSFLLFILVFIIIYVIDHISNINAIIYGAPQIIPGLSNSTSTSGKKIPKNRSKSRK